MRQYISTIILALFLVACDRHSCHWETLMQVETFIVQRPDSALAVLERIDAEELSSKEEKAKHALLLSMAFDKNVIDKTDFEVLQPAIDYYNDKGSATDKLRTCYYQGRIYENQGNLAQAMTCFCEGIEQGSGSGDLLTMANLYYSQGRIHALLFEWDKQCDVTLRAAELYKAVGRQNSYYKCLYQVLNACTQKEDYEQAERYIGLLKADLHLINPSIMADFYSAYITHVARHSTPEKIRQVLGEYLSLVPEKELDYSSIALAYFELGEYDAALDAINKDTILDNYTAQTRHLVLIADIYRKKGEYKLAFEAYDTYLVIRDKKLYDIYQSDTKFMEEKHSLEMQKAKETEAKDRLTIIVLVCIIVLMVLLYILNLIRKRLKDSRRKNALLESEKAHYEQMYNEVLAERNALDEMIADSSIKEETMEIIKKRLEVLNTIIVSHLSEKGTDVKRANDELERLIADRNDFIKSTRLTLEENYPHFFAYLKEKGVEDYEIDFCCLYAIGMKGKEIKTYTNLSRHYKDSSEVRQKLGLVESDTNLSNFLQNLLKNRPE